MKSDRLPHRNRIQPGSSACYTAQPLVWDDDVIRFRANKIVRFLLDAGPFDMNQLARMPFDREDYEQFAQLIGYSVSGFGDLSYASSEMVQEADEQAAEMSEERKREGV